MNSKDGKLWQAEWFGKLDPTLQMTQVPTSNPTSNSTPQDLKIKSKHAQFKLNKES